MRYDRPRPRRPPRRVRHRRHSVLMRRPKQLTRWQQFQRHLHSTILGITVPASRINIWLAIAGILFYLLLQLSDGN